MAKKYHYPSELKSFKGLKNAYQHIFHQAGGIPRLVALLKGDNKAFLELANSTLVKLEPKETKQDTTISINMVGIPQIEESTVLDIEGVCIDDTEDDSIEVYPKD